jgi:hypothetical protein
VLESGSGSGSADAQGTDAAAVELLHAARAGDSAAAERLVLDGTLQRWTEAGLVSATSASDPAVADALDTGFGPIGAWVTSAFGLFAVGLPTCP